MDKVWFPEDYKYSNEAEKDREIRSAQNLIRLLTRLIFIWFLKVKGLIPEDLFDKEKLKNIVKDFGNSYNYYNAILQNLFFATLNRPINERGWAKNEGFLKNRSNFGVKTLYRYEDKFLISPDEVLTLFKEIPFINGGLFDCLDKDSIYIDGFSRNFNKQAKIPDYLFFKEKEEIVDLSKYGLGRKPFRGLIEILKSYNFTTDEATPIDQEIALDPELLGKVFENLLASYNPETSTTARKATGSYYTPREIVDYMVEESLKEYFKIRLSNIPEEKIELLLSYSEEVPELSEKEKQDIISAIDKLKILDPACGSGAFPMGVLHKLVYVLQKIDPDNKYWYELQFQKAIKETEEVFKDIDKLRREELLKEINEAFDESINYPDYARKLYLIENCIYGVDIQPIAIQISKLRFFISLILDQKVDPNKENFGIRPLPHLETKFVSANTLIGLEKPQQLPLKNIEIAKKEEELKKLRHKHFRVKRREEKQKIEEQYKKIKKELVESLKKVGWNDKTAQNVVSFDPFDQNASSDWFDPEWMFGVTEGFDIVIGNPPYIRQEKIKDLKPRLQKQNYEVFTSKADIYVFFYEKGYKLLKNRGILSYITSNKWMRAKYGEKLRKFLKEKTTVIELIDFSGYRVFEQTVDTCIVLFRKQKPPKGHLVSFLEVKSDVENLEELLRSKGNLKVEQETGEVLREIDSWQQVSTWGELRDWRHAYTWKNIYQEKLGADVWTLGDEKVLALKEKIEKVGKPLKYWDVKIYFGIKTGFNEAFIIDAETRDRILANCKTEEERKRTEEIIKPVLRGRDIGRYYYKWAGLWVILTKFGFYKVAHLYPAIVEHLSKYEKQLKNRGQCRYTRGGKKQVNKDYEGQHHWLELDNNPTDEYLKEFEKEKVVWQRVAQDQKFTIVPPGFYCEATTHFITTKIEKNDRLLRYILGILNSKLFGFAFYKFYMGGGIEGEIKGTFIERFPIPPITQQNQPIADQIVKLVDQILSIKKQNPDADTSQLEKEIDQLIYNLYDMTQEEIQVIEGSLDEQK